MIMMVTFPLCLFQEQGGDGDDVDCYGNLVDNDAYYGFKSERAGGRLLPFKKEKAMMGLGGDQLSLLCLAVRFLYFRYEVEKGLRSV